MGRCFAGWKYTRTLNRFTSVNSLVFWSWRMVASAEVVPAVFGTWEITVVLGRTSSVYVHCAFPWGWFKFGSFKPFCLYAPLTILLSRVVMDWNILGSRETWILWYPKCQRVNTEMQMNGQCWSSAEMLWNHKFSSQLFSPAFLFWMYNTGFGTNRAVQPVLCTKQNPHLKGAVGAVQVALLGLQCWAGSWQSALLDLRLLCQGLTRLHLHKLTPNSGDGWVEVLCCWLQVRSTPDLALVLPLYLLTNCEALILCVHVTCSRHCFGIPVCCSGAHLWFILGCGQSIHLLEWRFGFGLVADWPTQIFSFQEMF